MPTSPKEKEYYRLWRLKNRESLLAQKKDDYLKNKDVYIKRAKEWGIANKEKRNLSSQKFRKNNPQKTRRSVSAWFSRHPEKRGEYKRKRRNLKYGAQGNHTEEEWIKVKEYFNFTCPSCTKKEPIIKLTRDHIIPLNKGGSDDIKNIQPLCGSCNSRKNVKTIRFIPTLEPFDVLCE